MHNVIVYSIHLNYFVEIMNKVISHWTMLDLCFSCYDMSKCFRFVSPSVTSLAVTFPRLPFTGESIYSYLNSHLSLMANSHSSVDLLGSSLHVWPDFHGNRSPLADPTLKGMVRQDVSGFM